MTFSVDTAVWVQICWLLLALVIVFESELRYQHTIYIWQ